MQFVDNINPNPLASRNAKDIQLTGITASAVSITVKRAGTAVCTFAAEPYSGSLRIRLRDILNSVLPFEFQVPPQDYGDTEVGTVSLEASATGQAAPTPWSRTAFRSGYDSSFHSALMNSYWWTWRDQRCRTFPLGKEYIGALFSSGTTQVKVLATFSDGTTSQENLCSVVVAADKKKFAVIDVSFGVIAELFPGKTIRSYKIQRGGSAYAQVYEVSRLPFRKAFIFRNSLGLFDTVYATGRISDGASRDVKTFISEDRSENIADNNSRERIYVNSGHVDTRGERTLWDEMVFSPDVWEWTGGKFRKIIIDRFDYKLQQGISDSLSFEYHYSEAPSGRGFEKSEI